jgi:hypothetical protein
MMFGDPFQRIAGEPPKRHRNPATGIKATGRFQTIRIQRREDGISIDQIVLSRVTYLARSPGATKNDATILPRTQ